MKKSRGAFPNQRCRGMRDLLPQDMARFRKIEDVFRRSCILRGYEEVRTPTLEYLYFFTAAGRLTPQRLRTLYSFLDMDGWSGERVVLRPDGTIPIARLYAENYRTGQTVRLFYVENTISYEETAREPRERWQCGAELIGTNRQEGDVELIELGLEVLEALSVGPVETKLFHAGITRGVLEGMNIPLGRRDMAVDVLLGGRAKELQNSSIGRLFRLRGRSSGFLRNIRPEVRRDFPRVEPALDDLIRVTGLLDELRLKYSIDPVSAGNFEYYTGVVFAFYVDGRKVGGGGRYDDLIPKVAGRAVPASGFALYVESLLGLMASVEGDGRRVTLRCETGAGGELKASFELAKALRRRGYVVELDHDMREKASGLAIEVGMRAGAAVFSIRRGKELLSVGRVPDVLRALEGK